MVGITTLLERVETLAQGKCNELFGMVLVEIIVKMCRKMRSLRVKRKKIVTDVMEGCPYPYPYPFIPTYPFIPQKSGKG